MGVGGVCKVGYVNVRTLLREGKLDMIKKSVENCGIELCAMTETRLKDKGVRKVDGWTMIWSGGDDGRVGGVGLLMNQRIENSWHAADMKWIAISNRLMMIEVLVKGGIMNIIVVYAPTDDKELEEKETFYEQLSEAYESVPKRNIIVMMGDWNARLDIRDMRMSWVGIL